MPTPSARSASSIASVPEATPTASRAPQKRGELALEGLHARSADVPAVVDDRLERLGQLGAETGVPAAEIDEWDVHASAQYRSPCSR